MAVVARASQERVRYSALSIQTTLMVLVSVLYASMLMALRYPCSMHLCIRSTTNDHVHNRQHRPHISPNVRRTCLDLACRPRNSKTCVSLDKRTTVAPPHPHADAPETHNTREKGATTPTEATRWTEQSRAHPPWGRQAEVNPLASRQPTTERIRQQTQMACLPNARPSIIHQ